MRWDVGLVIGLLVAWFIGLLLLGGPDSPFDADSYRLYASLPWLLPLGAIVIVWGLEQATRAIRAVLARLRRF